MKYKLKYSPSASDTLKELKTRISLSSGGKTASEYVSKITRGIRGLQENPQKGASVESMLGIPTPYRYLHIEHHYAFYRIEKDTVFVTDIYNEREDFLQDMFGINLRTQDSIDYWGE